MAAALMKNRKIDAVVVGADRVVANGDTANKIGICFMVFNFFCLFEIMLIGTYQLAIVADYHNVPYYIAVSELLLVRKLFNL